MYQDIARETVDDVYASSALALAFQDALVLAQQKEMVAPSSTATELIDFNETDKSALFFSLFDDLCRHRFLHAIVGFNDHCTSLVDLQDFDHVVALSPSVIPNLWKHLSNLRSVKGKYTKRDRERLPQKNRQVLLQIFALKRMRNQRCLKWWSLVQAVAYYVWGVGRTAIDATNMWGLTCGARS